MKYSEMILEGFRRVDGRQTKDWFYEGGMSTNPLAVCVNGAANLALYGTSTPSNGPVEDDEVNQGCLAFEEAWGIHPTTLNDGDEKMEGLPWEHIYGMARAAGL